MTENDDYLEDLETIYQDTISTINKLKGTDPSNSHLKELEKRKNSLETLLIKSRVVAEEEHQEELTEQEKSFICNDLDVMYKHYIGPEIKDNKQAPKEVKTKVKSFESYLKEAIEKK